MKKKKKPDKQKKQKKNKKNIIDIRSPFLNIVVTYYTNAYHQPKLLVSKQAFEFGEQILFFGLGPGVGWFDGGV